MKQLYGHMRKKHNLLIGERTAEDIKIKIGTVYSSPQPKSMEVKGRDTITGLPKSVTLTSGIKEALRDATTQIMETIHSVLRKRRLSWQQTWQKEALCSPAEALCWVVWRKS